MSATPKPPIETDVRGAHSLHRLVLRLRCWCIYWHYRRKCVRTGNDNEVWRRCPVGTPEGNAEWWGVADGIADHTQNDKVSEQPR